MKENNPTTAEVMIRLDEKMLEVLRRIDTFDKVIVPRSEFTIVIEELRSKHISNQKDIEEVQKDLKVMMYKLGFGLGSLQVITAIAMYLITKGV